jgi:hypothetical protein
MQKFKYGINSISIGQRYMHHNGATVYRVTQLSVLKDCGVWKKDDPLVSYVRDTGDLNDKTEQVFSRFLSDFNLRFHPVIEKVDFQDVLCKTGLDTNEFLDIYGEEVNELIDTGSVSVSMSVDGVVTNLLLILTATKESNEKEAAESKEIE